MEGYFIYVYRPEERDILINAGAKLIDVQQRIGEVYVFENSSGLTDLLEDGTYIVSNIISFGGCVPQ